MLLVPQKIKFYLAPPLSSPVRKHVQYGFFQTAHLRLTLGSAMFSFSPSLLALGAVPFLFLCVSSQRMDSFRPPYSALNRSLEGLLFAPSYFSRLNEGRPNYGFYLCRSPSSSDALPRSPNSFFSSFVPVTPFWTRAACFCGNLEFSPPHAAVLQHFSGSPFFRSLETRGGPRFCEEQPFASNHGAFLPEKHALCIPPPSLTPLFPLMRESTD